MSEIPAQSVERAEKAGRNFHGMVRVGIPFVLAVVLLAVVGGLLLWLAGRTFSGLPEGIPNTVPSDWSVYGVRLVALSVLGFALAITWATFQPWRTRGLGEATPEERKLARKIARGYEGLAVHTQQRLKSSEGVERYAGLAGFRLADRAEGRFLGVRLRPPAYVAPPANYWENVAGNWSQRFSEYLVPSLEVKVTHNERETVVWLPVASERELGELTL